LLPSIIGNHFEVLKSFPKLQNSVFKNFASPWFEDRNRVMAASTKQFDPNLLLSEECITPCPAIYQQYAQRLKDFRVVVVGLEVFVGSIDSSKGGEFDVRIDENQSHKYVRDRIPSHLIEKLQRLMRKLGLDYCAADFILTNSGEYFFLELNTCGSWWWINELYDNAIVEAIVAYLA
jgi:glutathione synthase/RimK-type ligase-like ATP-grasp enzyme